ISLRGSPGRRRETDGLSPRQREIARLFEQGYQRKEVAQSLGISEGTVKEHSDRMRARFGGKNTTELITILRRQGLI
ncbi:MAG: response regulator transcription factor, partial [Thermomicrobiales bacterium]